MQTEGCSMVAEVVLYSNRQLANLEGGRGLWYNVCSKRAFLFLCRMTFVSCVRGVACSAASERGGVSPTADPLALLEGPSGGVSRM
jgi:hypothetical protein